jgi:hypothetical protein
MIRKAIYAAGVSILLGAAAAAPSMASGEEDRMMTVEASFVSVLQDLQDAIVNRGLVIDYVGHVDTMLDRTAEASGIKETPYLNARYMQFCSSVLTHEASAADPSNLSMCPYLVFAYEARNAPGKVVLGYRAPDVRNDDASKAVGAKVEALLKEIIDEAAAQ